MKAHIIDENALRAVSPQALIAYAESEGWLAVEQFGSHSRVFGKNGKEAIIPATTKIADYLSVVYDLIEVFAGDENRDELQLYRDLTTSDKDVIRIRIPDAQANGSVTIGAGVDLVVHARDMLLSAACSAWDPRPSYRAGKVKQADEYMNRVRLGQTEQGSFILTMLAPVPPSISSQTAIWPEEEQEPFDRRVTRKLMSGLDAAAVAIEKHNLGAGISVFENAVEQGLSSNLCEATASLGVNSSSVEISLTWARTRRARHPRWMRSFSASDSEMLLEVARIFKDRQPRPDERVEGFITKLAREDNEFDGRISMRALVDGKYASVGVHLRSSDYDAAIAAHKHKQVVSLHGTLERFGSRWRLINPTDLHVASDDFDETVG